MLRTLFGLRSYYDYYALNCMIQRWNQMRNTQIPYELKCETPAEIKQCRQNRLCMCLPLEERSRE